MKKATYFFFALCVALFCALPLSAQIYTETYHRCHLIPRSSWNCGGGTYELTGMIANLKAYVRGVEQFDRSFTRTLTTDRTNYDFALSVNASGYSGSTPKANGMPGNLAFDYKDCTGELVIEAVAGQEFTIEGETNGHPGWLNGVLFVDWDGNGVFDDHDIDEYNLYGFSDWANEEHAGYGPDAEHPGLEPKWTIKVPADYPVEKTVRVRIRVDEGVGEAFGLRNMALGFTSEIYGATNFGCSSLINNLKQYFYSMYMHRFTPTGQGYRGTTVDVALKIKPNPYSDASVTGSQLITATGSVACTTNNTNWTAIKNEGDFKNFLANPSGNYYLANDITLTSVPQPSSKEFSGTFDGNGHTITYPTGTVATRGVLSKDECFYPYAVDYAGMRTQLQSFDRKQEGYASVDLTSYPEYDISGGFCGKLAHSGTIKNVKVVYSGAVTYDSGSQQVLFGLVAGIAKGRVENVSVDIRQPVQVQMTTSGRPSAVGGIAGILFGGIIKNCDVNVDNSFAINTTSGYAFETSALGGFVGRLQSGVIGNVKFSGNASGKLILHVNPASTHTMNYIGGIAGMTNTPKSIIDGYARTQYLYWGYDNGSTGLDVNNVILAYNGSMEMTQPATETSNFYCRGLLFGEACDTATVPNLITQYATPPTIEANCSDAQALSGMNIPLISKPLGSYNSNQGSSGKRIGRLYLYKDGRYSSPTLPPTSIAFTNVNVNNTKLDWAYEVQTLSNGSCVSFSTPYAVATNTTASAAGIANASANVSDLGGAVVKIDPQPATTPNPSWTWSNTATPTTPAVEPLVCTGGGGTCHYMSKYTGGNLNNLATPSRTGRTLNSFTLNSNNTAATPTAKNTVVSVTNIQTADTDDLYQNETQFQLVTSPGATLSFSAMSWTGAWMHAYVYIDYNNDGTFNQTTNPYGDNSGELVSYNYYTGKNIKGTTMAADCGVTATNIPAWTLPEDLEPGIYRLRVKVDYNNIDPRGSSSIRTDGGCICDITLNVTKNKDASDNLIPVYGLGAQPELTNNPSGNPATGYLTDLTANGTTPIVSGLSHTENHNVIGSPIVIPSGNLTLDFSVARSGSTDLKWTTLLAFVDLNGDGDFSDANERIYAQVGSGSDNISGLTFDKTSPDAGPWSVNKTVLITGTQSMLRIYTIGECNTAFKDNPVNMSIYNTGCANSASGVNGDSNSNKFHCYDFPIQIGTSTGGTCKYVHDFGEVGVGDTATYTMPIGEAFTINTGLSGTNFTANKNGDNLELTYTPTATGDHTDKLVINYGGNNYDVELTGKGVNFPTLTFQIGEDGGGSISTDMGKTTKVEPIKFTNYQGELLTAVPQGPCAIEGWYVDEGDGNGFVKQTDPVTHSDIITPDFTYTGTADNVTVEVRFKFEDFEGDFGNSRFTDNTHLPFYISTITTTGGIVNVNATNVFTEATVVGGSAHLNYLTNQRLQTLTHKLTCPDCPDHSDATACKNMSHEITVTVANPGVIPTNARLLCFIDYNYNGWFDFVSSPDGLASKINKNQIGKPLSATNNKLSNELSELVYVGEKGDGTVNADGSITFTFTITNDNPVDITKYGKTRMRFMVATYVDMYGLGPVNQYGNYQPRFDTDGDGVADAYLPLNDSNGSLYSPNNECRYENYINVADVNFEVVAYIKATDTYTIEAGTSTRMGDLYIESVEDENGINSGRIIFGKGNPTGSLQVEGNIVVRKRIYQDRWHDIAFPINMQGSSGTKGICAVDANGGLHKLADDKWLLVAFRPENRNRDDGYGNNTFEVLHGDGKTQDVLAANTFYEFAADNVGEDGVSGAVLGSKPVNHYWIQFHSEHEGFHITAKSAEKATLTYARDQESSEYWNQNIFTLYNPYLSSIYVREITTSPDVKWENLMWWNAYDNCFKPVSAASNVEMPPYFGYWVQFTEDIATTQNGENIEVILGDVNRTGYAYPNDGIITIVPTSTTGAASSFDMPDAYTLGIDRAAATLGKQAASRTIVTLTDIGSVDEFRAGYDRPVSYADATSTVPEIWSKAGSSRMMFNDVMRDNEVVVPVGIRIKEAGEYVIRLTDTNFAESLVQLYDKQTGARVDLQRNGELFSYNFLADAGDADSRFDLIIIAPESMTDLEVIEQDEVPTAAAIYKAGSTLRIVNMPLGYTVSVCDVIGREVLHTTVVDADMQLELPNSQGVYLVNVRNEKGAAVQVLKLAR